MNRLKLFLFAVILFILIPSLCRAQSEITFRIDMTPQIKDSTFIPEIGTVRIKGNLIPFSNIHTIVMRDHSPKDSIYVAKIHFPSIVNGETLKYRFTIRMPYKTIKESYSRLLKLEGRERKLPVAFFNNFAR